MCIERSACNLFNLLATTIAVRPTFALAPRDDPPGGRGHRGDRTKDAIESLSTANRGWRLLATVGSDQKPHSRM